MELVYLWVEDYKNIHKQGFNFSPKFECKFYDEYDEYGKLKDNCKLEIIEKKDDEYIKDFFGENINVTAIVGKNGSGKSSIFECLLFINKKFNYVLVYENEGDIYYKSNIGTQIRLREKSQLKKNNSNLPIKTFIYTSDYFKDYRNHIKLSKNYILSYLLHMSIEKDFELTSFMYIPTIIEINSKYIDMDLLFKEVTSYDYDNYVYADSLSYDDNRKSMYIAEDKLNQLYTDISDKYHKFLVVLFLKYCDDAHDYLEQLLNFDDVLILLDNCDIKYPTKDEFESYIQNYKVKKAIAELNNTERKLLLKYSDFYEYDFIDSLDRNYNDLSYGERTIFGQFLAYYNELKNHYSKSYIFLIDEGELSLHPDWQKRYIFELYNLLKKLDKTFHFIFATHSPFLLSDIPKQNIIFLDKDENGNCKVADGLKEKKQTFGANIHTLLSDSFFMDKGLMGEFAKAKIDKAIKLLNQDKLDEKELKYCEQIISIVGEPIVKNQLQRMLDSKRLSKMDVINKKIKEMSYELEVLKEYQSKIVKEELRNKGKKRYKERLNNDKNSK